MPRTTTVHQNRKTQKMKPRRRRCQHHHHTTTTNSIGSTSSTCSTRTVTAARQLAPLAPLAPGPVPVPEQVQPKKRKRKKGGSRQQCKQTDGRGSKSACLCQNMKQRRDFLLHGVPPRPCNLVTRRRVSAAHRQVLAHLGQAAVACQKHVRTQLGLGGAPGARFRNCQCGTSAPVHEARATGNIRHC